MATASTEQKCRVPFPDRESIPEEDRAEYDYVFDRVQKLVGGQIEQFPYVGACLSSPPFAASLWRFSGRMLAAPTAGNTFTQRDREHINFVFAFDFPCYNMLFGHFDYAVQQAGIRPEMVRALWEGRDEDLLPDERQLVDFIRAYVAGTVTKEMWEGIVERFGSVRAAVEYSLTIGYNLLCARSMMAWGVEPYTREEMEQMVRNITPLDDDALRQMRNASPFENPELLSQMKAG